MSEDKLIKKAKNGNSEAFGKLYDDHIDQIYRYIFLRINKKSDAEDITQKVFLKAWKNIDSFEIREKVPFSSWLYRIAKNTMIDYYRTDKNHPGIEDVSEREIGEAPEDHERNVDDEIKVRQIKESLDELTENQQNVIIMKFIEELENGEIAEILDKTEVAVRVTQHRALKKLKKIVKEKQEEE